jgi:phage gpG-like protein
VNLRTGEISVGFGSNVKYFAIHEFGFQGEVQVKQHSRRTVGQKFNNRGKLTKRTTERMKKNLRNGGSSGTMVRAHRRKLDVPARAPLGTELKSIRTRAAFMLALKKALEPLLRGK